MSISSLSLLLTEGLEVGGGDTAGLVGVKAGIPNGSTLDWEGPGEENGLADTAKEINVEYNIHTVKLIPYIESTNTKMKVTFPFFSKTEMNYEFIPHIIKISINKIYKHIVI